MRQPINRMPGVRTTASKWLVRACLALSCAPAAAFAQFGLTIALGMPPPVAVVEAQPPPRHGYVYAPGYWAWHGDRHIWIGGHWMLERPGYYWVAEHWQPVGGRWHFVQGHWAPHKHKHKPKHRRDSD